MHTDLSYLEKLDVAVQKKELKRIFKDVADVHKRLTSLIGRVAHSEGPHAEIRFLAATRFAKTHNIPLENVISPKTHEKIKAYWGHDNL